MRDASSALENVLQQWLPIHRVLAVRVEIVDQRSQENADAVAEEQWHEQIKPALPWESGDPRAGGDENQRSSAWSKE